MVDHKKVTRTRRIVEDFVFCLFRGEKVMPVLYYIVPSAPCRAVRLLGRLLNIEFELRLIDMSKGEHLKPEYLEVRERRRDMRSVPNIIKLSDWLKLICLFVSFFLNQFLFIVESTTYCTNT